MSAARTMGTTGHWATSIRSLQMACSGIEGIRMEPCLLGITFGHRLSELDPILLGPTRW